MGPSLPLPLLARQVSLGKAEPACSAPALGGTDVLPGQEVGLKNGELLSSARGSWLY